METNTINLDGVDDANCLMSQVYELIVRVETVEAFDGSPGEDPKDSIETFALLVKESMRDSSTPIDPDPAVNEARIESEISLLCALEWALLNFAHNWGRNSELSFAAINLLLLARMKLRQELAEVHSEINKAREAKEAQEIKPRRQPSRAAQAVADVICAMPDRGEPRVFKAPMETEPA